MSDLREQLADLGLGCLDGNCVWRRPRGMRTHGGCRCITTEIKAGRWWEALNADEQRELAKRQRNVVHGVRRMRDDVAQLEARVEALEEVLRELRRKEAASRDSWGRMERGGRARETVLRDMDERIARIDAALNNSSAIRE